jgi:ribosomal protein S24E
MEFKLIEEKENPLFSRKEVVFDVNAKVTPSNDEVEKLITEKFSTESGNIKIKKIHGRFGSNDFNVSAFIYKTKEDKNKIEPRKKGEEAPTETPKEEIKEEPVKEEIKEEKQDA